MEMAGVVTYTGAMLIKQARELVEQVRDAGFRRPCTSFFFLRLWTGYDDEICFCAEQLELMCLLCAYNAPLS